MRLNKLNEAFGKQYVKFLLYGGLNTLFTYFIYLLLSTFLYFQLAYFLAYVSGIVMAYFLNLRFVFKESNSLGKIIIYPFIYAAQYFIGAVMLHFFVNVFEISKLLSPILVAVILVPTSYGMNKKILAKAYTK